ncbi:hypothetical protein AgCh_004475 [Apium graveolens]
MTLLKKLNPHPNTESKLSLLNTISIYVSRDERLSPIKLTDFLAYGLKAVIQFLDAEFKFVWDTTPTEFDSFKDVHRIYEGGVKLPAGIVERIRQNTPLEILRELFPVDGEGLAKFPTPQVIKGLWSFVSVKRSWICLIREHKGKNYEVIDEARVFVGAVRDATNFVSADTIYGSTAYPSGENCLGNAALVS